MADDTYEKVGESDARWFPGSSQSSSGFWETDDEFRNAPRNNLQYIPKRQVQSMRPFLKATFEEILCYLRLYVTSISKTQMVCVMEQNMNWFFWYRMMNAVFKSISHVFVQIFIAAYVPEEHFYLDKMNPMMFGYNLTVIIAAFFELLLIINSNIFLLDYFIEGVTQRAPWNRCVQRDFKPSIYKKKYLATCYTLEAFNEKIKAGNANNQTLYFFNRIYFYKNATNSTEYFQISQIVYFRNRIKEMKHTFQGSIFGVYFIAVWLTAALHNNQLFKKNIWKILKIAHYTEIAVYIVILFYVYIVDNVVYDYNGAAITQIQTLSQEKHVLVDIDFISLSMNAPPVAHILFSRFKTDHSKIHYNLYSMLLVTSNCIYGFLIGFTNQLIVNYCEYTLGSRIKYSDQNINIFFYFYPIFFSRFYFGNIFLSILIFFKLISDYYLFVITFQCLIECIVWEWRYTTNLMMTACIVLAAVMCYLLMKYRFMVAMYMYSKNIVNIAEIYTIFLIYPLGRLIEDMTFHSGSIPNRVRIWNLRFVPIYVTYKVYTIVTQMEKMSFFRNTGWTWMVPLATLALGAVYAIVNTLFVDKRSWTALFHPEPEWGPEDGALRYCRKMYKMDQYIGSQAERNLGRYMLGKAETEMYRLDVRSDTYRRRSSAPGGFMRYEDEKKIV